MSRKMRMALSGVALLVIVAMAWFFLISPLRANIAATDSAIATESTRLAAAQAKLAQAEVTRAEGKKNQARLLELAKMVPINDQVPSLLVQIQDLADQSGIKFISVSPGSPTDSGLFQMIPLALQFSGSYFNLKDFAYRVEQLVASPGRLLTVKSVQLQLGGQTTAGSTAPAKAGPDLTVSMTLYAFSMDQAGAAPPAVADLTAAQPAGAGAAGTTTTTVR
jgi:Tfp pilus assembly protein PilO